MVKISMIDGKPVTDATWDAATGLMRELPFHLKIELFRKMDGPLPPKRRDLLRRVVMCDLCGDVVLRKGHHTMYCEPCSTKAQYRQRAEFYRRHRR